LEMPPLQEIRAIRSNAGMNGILCMLI